MMILAPSILAADFAKLGAQIVQLDKAGAQYVHIDVMDGIFVPSISFGFPIIRSIRKLTNRFFDVHLSPERRIVLPRQDVWSYWSKTYHLPATIQRYDMRKTCL